MYLFSTLSLDLKTVAIDNTMDWPENHNGRTIDPAWKERVDKDGYMVFEDEVYTYCLIQKTGTWEAPDEDS